ncbi:MAG: cytochrome P450 [Hyphomonadaceae bacterium]|nr:cytochrome P450 [Hyphomonadaceae bacterium]
MSSCPHKTVSELRKFGRIFYNLDADVRLGAGCWIPTRAEDIRAVLNDAALFSSRGMAGFAALLGEHWDLIPVEKDPPEHSAYRAVLNPLFGPTRMRAIEARIRVRARELLGAAGASSQVEFISAFGTPFPVSIFLELMGLPLARLEEFVEWTDALLRGATIPDRVAAAQAIAAYLRAEIDERKKHPADDVITYLSTAEVFGRRFNEDELIGSAMLIFLGGIDTVASSLGFHFLHLARNPALQAQLRANPEQIPVAVEELLRAYAIVGPHRRVTRDVEFAGVKMCEGDWVLCVTALANLDPEETMEPLEFRMDRGGARHLTFSYGPHRCLGAHLARRELIVALETWLLEAPAFEVASEADVRIHGGSLLGVDHLPLRWLA